MFGRMTPGTEPTTDTPDASRGVFEPLSEPGFGDNDFFMFEPLDAFGALDGETVDVAGFGFDFGF